MNSPTPSTPPKFVPTLTEVVQMPANSEIVEIAQPVSDTKAEPLAAPVPAPAGYELPTAQIDEAEDVELSVDDFADATTQGSSADSDATAPTVVPAEPLPDGYEEYVVHRVMQRVDVILEARLRDAIATVIQEQTRSIVPRLREEVESVVRQSVYEAVAEELGNQPRE